jgi:phosphatidate cytidylyltransferase
MCYVSGRSFGKTPIFPKVSPKKTVEGLVGGVVLTLLLVGVLNHFYIQLENSQWVLLTLTISFFALWGDYTQSFMKRKIGIKDSGKLIPGHGGILDRIDSVLFSALPFIIILRLLTLN